MNRNRHGGRERGAARNFAGVGDGLLGEGPSMGGSMYNEAAMVNPQINQLMLAQQLLQQQAALGGGGSYGGGGADFGMGDMGAMGALAGAMGSMQFLQPGMGYGGAGGGMRNERKRSGGQGRDGDFKRRRRDSSGRGGDRDRSRARDGNRGGESRDRNRSSRWDSDLERKNRNGRGADVYDPAEPTEDEVSYFNAFDQEIKDKDSNLYCHVCNVSVYDGESFRRHLNGTKHTQRMSNVLTVHQMKSNQLKSRLKAEEHLRKIEGKRGGQDPDYFCKICNNSLTIPWERHRFSNIHKQRQLQVKRGCGWCNVHDFTNFTEVLEHRETVDHKINAQQNEKNKEEKGRGGRSRSRSRSRQRRSEKYRSLKKSSSRERGRKEKDAKLREKARKRKEEEEEDLTIPEFDAENPVGLNYIIPVTGFFCKLCHKFYNNEKSAKGAHCQSEAHYEKFKLATEAKIAAREKRRAEEAEEERKAKEEEEKKKAEGKDGDDKEKGDAAEEGDETKDEKDDDDEEDEDEEDYDDELPIEDEDDDGGLVKEDTSNVVEEANDDVASKDTIGTESFLNDTNANSSFVFLSGDMAAAHIELQRQEELQQQKPKAEASVEEMKVKSEDTDMEAVNQSSNKTEVAESSGRVDTSIDLSEEGTEKEEEAGAEIKDDEAVATSTPIAAEPKKSPGRARGGTARRGRGRGRGKKAT